VRVEGWEVEDKGWKKGVVDWGKFKVELEVWKGRGLVLRKGKVERKELEEVVEEMEVKWRAILKKCKERKRWESGRKRWWDSELEEKRKMVREREREEEWRRGRKEEDRREVRVERGEYRKMIEEKKARYWLEYLEGLKRGEGFKLAKMDRNFVTEVPAIRGEDRILVQDNKKTGREIVRGLGKREELKQEGEGFWKEIEVEKEEIKGALWKQGDEKAVGVNGLSGKIL